MRVLHEFNTGSHITYYCANCGAGRGFDLNYEVMTSFLRDSIDCDRCGETFKLIDGYFHGLNARLGPKAKLMRTEKAAEGLYELIGQRLTVLEYELRANERKLIDLDDVGLPADAKILSLRQQLSSHDQDIWAEPVVGVSDGLQYANSERKLVVEGIPRNNFERPASFDTSIKSTKIQVWLSWLENENAVKFSALYSSIRLFEKSHMTEAIVSANTAVEMMLFTLCETALNEFAGKKTLDNFLGKQCTYSGQSNVLLGMICRLHGLAVLPNDLLGQLNRLRKLRNDVAHRGKFASPVDGWEIFNLICAAVLCVHAFDAFQMKVLEAQKSN